MKIDPITKFENLKPDGDFLKLLKYLPSTDKYGPWIAGGSVRKSVMGEDLGGSDIDYFFKTKNQYDAVYHRLQNIPIAKILSKTENKFNNSYKVLMEIDGFVKEIMVQLIDFKFYKNMSQLFEDFDFNVCQFGIAGEFLYYGDCAIDAALSKQITINSNNIRHPQSCLRHLKKYITNGFVICNYELQVLIEKLLETPKGWNQVDAYGAPPINLGEVLPATHPPLGGVANEIYTAYNPEWATIATPNIPLQGDMTGAAIFDNQANNIIFDEMPIDATQQTLTTLRNEVEEILHTTNQQQNNNTI